MMRRGILSGRRLATFAAAAALILSLAGDRGRAATVPASVYGQDPLEVLELKVRPNVILVLDSSGSMQYWLPTNSFTTNSGDHPRSRLHQAKEVVRTVVQNNQEKVSFQMGTYTMYGNSFNNQSAGAHRFQYVVSSADASFMTTLSTELTVRGAVGDSLGRGLQSWQIIYPEWGTLYFEESVNGSSVNASCAATLPALPRFYARGDDLATDLATAMTSAACTTGSVANEYGVSYSTSSGVFTFSRKSGTRYWRIVWGRTPNNIRNSLAETSTSTTSWQTTGTRSTDYPYTLLYRQTGTSTSGTGLNSRWQFSETIDGATVTFYHLRAGRLWNGEVIRVNSSGEVCGMDFATAATKTSPPSITIQAADSSCVATGDTAKFDWGGGSFTGNNNSCNGFRSKSQLIPCDLKIPPSPTQFTMIGPYVDEELPFDANGDPADWSGDGKADYIEEMDGSWATDYVNVAPSAKASGSTPIANSLIDIKGTANGSDYSCITNAEAIYPTLDQLSGSASTGRCGERNFTKMWNTGPTDTGSPLMPPTLGSGPWSGVPTAQRAIKNHADPKEKTIVIFVTDGDDTCSSRQGNLSAGDFNGWTSNVNEQRARRAAYYAEALYRRIDPNEPASSVQTYMIGYGGSFPVDNPYYLNLIAWGGSGLGQGLAGQPDVDWDNDSENEIRTARALCTTCQDAFIAPDGATLARQLQSIIDQGASDGDFNAQQSITETIFEYVDYAKDNQGNFTFSPADPKTRYNAIVPTRFVSSFSLPGFKGQLRAFQNDGNDNAIERWSAGDKLTLAVSTAMTTCNSGSAGGAVGQCVFPQLHARSSFSDPVSGSSWAAKIQRRIYSTDRNGVFSCTGASCTGAWDPETLIDLGAGGNPPHRVTLWPPEDAMVPDSYTSVGSLDAAIGLPPNSPPDFPPNSPDPDCRATSTTPKSYTQCWLDTLQRDFKACLGSNLPSGCTSSNTTTQMQAARREAREIAFAFMAGATPQASGLGIARTSATYAGAAAGSILYKAREWVLADSEMATAAVVTQPSPSEPEATAYVAEYRLYRDGVRDASTKNPDTAGDQIRQGFGLTDPDDDGFEPLGARNNLKPVMTVVYAPANDMLHAFRAGTNCASRTNTCAETGGEELWGFVPYDQLNVLYLRAANQPQGRDNHVFSLARGVRFADVFVPGAMTQKSIGGVPTDLQGAWRRVVFFGRGIGGKYVTALDVTGPGPFTTTALNTMGPVPLWSRGNPDTADGIVGSGTLNGTTAERDWYAKMGETWSIPAVAFVNKDNANTIYNTSRYPNGINFAIFMGSGYGAAGEGTTHYALDALSGDVIAAVDVEQTAENYGINRTGLPYPNAIVANSVSFNRSAFASLSAKAFNVNPHPWSNVSARVYVGDVHGHLWKFLTDRPDVAIPVADLGTEQAVGTAVALLAQYDDAQMTTIPVILLSTGAERRSAGPFRNFAFTDLGTDFATATTGTDFDDGVTTYAPVVKNFARTFDQGDAVGGCDYAKEAVFRGTIQPTGAVECDGPLTGSRCEGTLLERAFFGGTRLSVPNTKYAPPTPLACQASYACPDETDPNKTCTSTYPCRSQFDSILYALGVQTGGAAYDLNAAGDDAYRIFRDSRIAAISVQADPDPGRGGSRFVADEGLMKGTPKPPPPPGIPPTATTATANVVFTREPGSPAPAVRYGTTVCQ